MKRILLTACSMMVLVMSVMAQPKTSAEAKAKAYADTLQYALGVYLMKSLANNGMGLTTTTMLKKGIDDYVNKAKLMIPEASVEPRIVAYQNATQQNQGKIMEETLFSLVKKQPGVLAMGNGVHIAVVKSGEGRRPDIRDTVVINVIGTLADGTVFIDSNKDKQSFMTLVRDLVPGLQGAILQMPEGSVWRVFVPAAQGFGATGNGTTVPPNAPLIYDIGLVSVKLAKY